MKKATLTILLIAFAMIGFAQVDSSGKPIAPQKEFVYERSDTAIVRVILYAGADGNVKYFTPGYVLLKGYAVKRLKPITVTTGAVHPESDYQWQWTEQPKTGAILDNKKQRLDDKKVLQLIQ